MHTQCVIREVRGTNEFVLVSDVLRRIGKLVPNEKVYVGRFSGYSQSCGPYGSDRRTLCLPTDGVEFAHASDDGKSVVLPIEDYGLVTDADGYIRFSGVLSPMFWEQTKFDEVGRRSAF